MIVWYNRDQVHRTNGPAIIQNGEQTWYYYGSKHRENDQPAVICTNGDRIWYYNGQIHRINGPAKILDNGNIQEYFINGLELPYIV